LEDFIFIMKIFTNGIKTFFLLLIIGNFISFNAGKSSNNPAEDVFVPQIKKEDSTKSLNALERDIDRIINDADLKGARFSVAVYSLDTKHYYFRKNIGDMLTPASVTKLFTCFSAYFKYGCDYKIKTQILANSEIKNGVLNGNLYIKGHGDAIFSTSDLNSLVEQLKKSGLKAVTGSVIADGSYFDDITDRFQYSGDRDVVQGVQPITALSIDQNIVTVNVRGSEGGRPVTVELIPPSDAFKLNITARTTGRAPAHKSPVKGSHGYRSRKSRYASNIYNEYSLKETGFGGPLLAQKRSARIRENHSGINVSVKNLSDGNQQIIVSGSLDPEKSYIYKHHILKPVLAVAGALRNRLIASGISVKGSYSEITTENEGLKKQLNLLAEFSRPMPDIISPMMKHSDNYLAENFFKIVGASGKLKNNAKEAKIYMSAMLDSLRFNCEECTFNDGSGLSRRNKVNAETLIKILDYTSRSSFGKSYDTTFSIAGVDGTLKNRMIGTLAENNLHAKTGTHGNVSALTGYVKTLDGERLAFAMIFNGFNVNHFKAIENEIGRTLAQFFYYNIEK